MKTSAAEILETVPAEEANRMAYKDMKMSYYLTATLSFYAVIIAGSIAIPDIALVFDFASAIAVSAIGYFFPGYFYPLAIRKFGVQRTWKVKRNICISYVFLVLGSINFCLGIFVAIVNITSE